MYRGIKLDRTSPFSRTSVNLECSSTSLHAHSLRIWPHSDIRWDTEFVLQKSKCFTQNKSTVNFRHPLRRFAIFIYSDSQILISNFVIRLKSPLLRYCIRQNFQPETERRFWQIVAVSRSETGCNSGYLLVFLLHITPWENIST